MSADRAPWVLVAGGFHLRGAMDRSNAELARYLAERGHPVELVGHDVDAELAAIPGIRVHRVPCPLGSLYLGESRLRRTGRAVAEAAVARDPRTRVVVNGGNCDWPGINWAHSVHHAWPCVHDGAPWWFAAKSRLAKRSAMRTERESFSRARLILANSERTRRDLAQHFGLDPQRIHTVYLGSDPARGEATAEDRAAGRRWLGVGADVPVVAFVGALSYDSNKGFDTLWEAWRRLSQRPDWDGVLIAAGGGSGVESWRDRTAGAGLEGRIRLLGFSDRVPDLLAASDLLVSPVRYEAYGMNVHEAICRGRPAMVSRQAGVAERYPAELGEMLIPDPEDVDALVERLGRWGAERELWAQRFAPLAAELRAHTWTDMAERIVALAGSMDRSPLEAAPASAV